MNKKVDLLSIFAKNMRNRRKDMDLTQKELAIKSGISSSFITDVELGKKSPSFSNISKIASALDAPPWTFFIDNGNEISSKTSKDEVLAITLKDSISKQIDEILKISK